MTGDGTTGGTDRRGRSVAFLRGVNIGKRKATKDQLVAAVGGCGLSDVDTFLASGNVLFSWPGADDGDDGARREARIDLERRLEEALEDELGFPAAVTIRPPDQLRALAAVSPFDDQAVADAAGKPQVMLAFDQVDEAAVERALALSTDDDRLVHRAGELFWLPVGGMARAALDVAAVEAALGGTTVTVRTLATIDRLTARL